MNIIDIIKEAFHSLRVNIKRTFLTVLGIVIGIFAVTIMLSLGEGIKQSISADLSSAKEGDVVLSVVNDKKLFDAADLDWLQKQLYVKQVLAMNKIYSQKVSFGSQSFNVSMESVLGPFEEIEKMNFVSGKSFDWKNPDLDRLEVLVSSRFAKVFKEKTKQDALHKKLFIKGKKYEVIGIYKDRFSEFAMDDGTMYVPTKTLAENISGEKGYKQFAVHLKEKDYYKVTSQHIKKSFNLSRGLSEKSYDFVMVNTPQAVIEQTKKFTSKFNLFLGIIGGISLLVGGIGTMNMMLTTISERTKEIGLRKAIGAKNRDITMQILFESIFVTLLGGILGIILTWLIALLVNKFIPEDMGFKLALSLGVITISVSVAVLVGIIFGISPARKAAKLQPVDALRSE